MNVKNDGKTVTLTMDVNTAKTLVSLMDHSVLNTDRSDAVLYGYRTVRDTLVWKLTESFGMSFNSIPDMHALYRQVEEALTKGTVNV